MLELTCIVFSRTSFYFFTEVQQTHNVTLVADSIGIPPTSAFLNIVSLQSPVSLHELIKPSGPLFPHLKLGGFNEIIHVKMFIAVPGKKNKHLSSVGFITGEGKGGGDPRTRFLMIFNSCCFQSC